MIQYAKKECSSNDDPHNSLAQPCFPQRNTNRLLKRKSALPTANDEIECRGSARGRADQNPFFVVFFFQDGQGSTACHDCFEHHHRRAIVGTQIHVYRANPRSRAGKKKSNPTHYDRHFIDEPPTLLVYLFGGQSRPTPASWKALRGRRT